MSLRTALEALREEIEEDLKGLQLESSLHNVLCGYSLSLRMILEMLGDGGESRISYQPAGPDGQNTVTEESRNVTP